MGGYYAILLSVKTSTGTLTHKIASASAVVDSLRKSRGVVELISSVVLRRCYVAFHFYTARNDVFDIECTDLLVVCSRCSFT